MAESPSGHGGCFIQKGPQNGHLATNRAILGLDDKNPYTLKEEDEGTVLRDGDGVEIEYRAGTAPVGAMTGDVPLPQHISAEEIAESEAVQLSGFLFEFYSILFYSILFYSILFDSIRFNSIGFYSIQI